MLTEAFWRASMNNAPLYRALYAGLLFFIFDLRYASPLINAPAVVPETKSGMTGKSPRQTTIFINLQLPGKSRCAENGSIGLLEL